MAGGTLTTTHMALLSLLSTKPWSAYDLVGQMGRSVGAVWPRAQSNLYADLKRLAAEGLARAEQEATGRRPRTVYRITPAGRRALRAWLAEPGAPPASECEALLKLSFAPATTKEAALAQIDAIGEWARERLAFGIALGAEYVETGGRFPERTHVNALMWRFLHEQHLAYVRWADWARAEVEQWDDTEDSPDKRRRGLAAIRQALR